MEIGFTSSQSFLHSLPRHRAKQKEHGLALAGNARQTLIQPESPGPARIVEPLRSFQIRAELNPDSEVNAEHTNILSVNPQPLDLPNHLIVPSGNAIAEGAHRSSAGAAGTDDSAGPPQSSSPVIRETVENRTETSTDNTWSPFTVASPIEPPAQPKQKIIERSSSGNFDAVVVQASPSPGAEGSLLKGPPVYTVYIAVGTPKDTPKDWMLYLCSR
jgi:hypothetical protein